MVRMPRLLLALGASALLAGCGLQLQEARDMEPEGTAHDENLYQGYVNLASKEYGEGDYVDSDRFARRAQTAGQGRQVQPEMVEGRRGLPADKREELSAARKRLLAALADDAAQRKPIEAARAQVSFDCWLQEQEENRQPSDIEACRRDFMTNMAKLEDKPEVAAAPSVAPDPLPGVYVVNFDFDKSDIRNEDMSILKALVRSANKAEFGKISVKGHTDLVGPYEHNLALSKKRADAVVDFLLESGLQKEKIVSEGRGMREPVVNTPEPELRNRRVEVTFSR